MSFSDILGKPSHNIFFHTDDCTVIDVGFDDFRTVKPCKTPRIQAHYTLHLVLSGAGTVDLCDKRFSVHAGEGFVLPPGVSICYYPKAGEEWSYIWFGLSGEAKDWITAAGFTVNNPIFTTKNPAETTQMLSDMILKTRSASLSDYLYAKSVFLRLMAELCEGRGVKTRGESSHRAAVSEILCLIDANYQIPALSVSMLCDIVHLSHSYLCKIFPKETGKTIKEAIIERRMAAARLLLAEGKNVKEAAGASGYPDAVHFSKEFTRYFGVTPGKYRSSYYELPQSQNK